MNSKKMNSIFHLNPARFRVLALMLGDSLCGVSVFWLVLWGYRFFVETPYNLGIYTYFLPFLALFLICNSCCRCYQGSFFYPGLGLNKPEEIRRLSYSVVLTYLLIYTCLMFAREGENYSRLGLFISMCLTIPALPVVRFFVRCLMKACRVGQINVLIAGAGDCGELICSEFKDSSFYGFNVVGYLDCDPQKQGMVIGGYPVLGPLSAAKEIAAETGTDYLVSCLPLAEVNRRFQELSAVFRHVMVIPDAGIMPISWSYPVSIGLFGGFEIRNQLLLRLPRLFKSILEIFLAFFAVLALLPLFLVLAVLVKLSSPGPVFYFANRLGLNGKKIRVLKFRTMYADADARLECLLEEDPALKAEWEKEFKLQHDPRITPIGSFLRKTSLDELPQFWNVLTGDMAVIGPRPIIQDEVRHYGETYELRQRVKPGITGLWQVSGRNDVDYRQRVLLDMYYIMNWSIWLDYYIFFKTIFVVLNRNGAR